MPNQRYEPHHKICNLRYGTPDTLLPLQVQSVALRQTPGTIGFSHRLCSVMFSLYDNKMSGIFQYIYTRKTGLGFADRNEIRSIVIMKKNR